MAYFDRIEAGLNPDLDNIISNYVQSVLSMFKMEQVNNTTPIEAEKITTDLTATVSPKPTSANSKRSIYDYITVNTVS